MNTAKDLLTRALDAWDFVDEPQFDDINKIMKEIHRYLKDEKELEPNCYGDGNVYRGIRSKDSEIKTVFVSTRPDPNPSESIKNQEVDRTRKPMTEPEPVAFVNLDKKRLEWAAPFDFKSSCFVLGKLPLYFHPPRPEPARKPMTTYGKDDSTMQSMCRGDKE